MDLHELVSALKDLSIELGRTPTQKEFSQAKGLSPHTIKCVSGGYSPLCQAAGLDPNVNQAKKKIDNSIFTRDLEAHLNVPIPIDIKEYIYPTIGIISDIHWPFCEKRVVNRFIEFIGINKPSYVILNGDAWDMYSHSKFPRSHNVFLPKEEERLARESNEQFWKSIQEASPKSQCVQMMGNHDVRPMKRILEVYPEAEDWVTEKLKSLFTFNSVKTIMDPREELILGDVAIFHGYRGGLGDHRDFTLMNCINGHTHKGGAVFRQIRGQVLWELNSGVAGDPLAKGLTYTPQRITNWTPGFAYLWPWGPQFIPA